MIVLNDRTRLTDLVYKYHLTVPKALWGAFHFFCRVLFQNSPSSHSCCLSCRTLHSVNALLGTVSLEENDTQSFSSSLQITDLVQYMEKHCLKQCFFVFFTLIYSYIPLKFQRLPNRLLDLGSGLNPSAKFPYPTHFHHT